MMTKIISDPALCLGLTWAEVHLMCFANLSRHAVHERNQGALDRARYYAAHARSHWRGFLEARDA